MGASVRVVSKISMASFAAKRNQRDASKPKSYIIHSQSTQSTQSDSTIRDTDRSTSGDISHKMYKGLPSSLEIRSDSVKGRGIWSKQLFRRGVFMYNIAKLRSYPLEQEKSYFLTDRMYLSCQPKICIRIALIVPLPQMRRVKNKYR